MKTTDSEPFCDQDVDYVQHSTDLLATQGAGNRIGTYTPEPITTPQQVEIVVNWETVRREAQKVTNTQFFEDLMVNLVALRHHRASPSVASNTQPV